MPPCKLTFDLFTLKVVSESRVTWSTPVPILVFLGLSVVDLGPMYATDRRSTDVRRASSLNALGSGHNNAHNVLRSDCPIRRWLQLRFDFDSTLVRRAIHCLSKVAKCTTDVPRWFQSRRPTYYAPPLIVGAGALSDAFV